MDNYSETLHKVIDVLREQPPIMWILVGNAISDEGMYQQEAEREGRTIEYD